MWRFCRQDFENFKSSITCEISKSYEYSAGERIFEIRVLDKTSGKPFDEFDIPESAVFDFPTGSLGILYWQDRNDVILPLTGASVGEGMYSEPESDTN